MSDPASKATLDIFTYHSGEEAWKPTSTSNLMSTATPFPVAYKAVAKRIDEAMSLYSSVVPSVLVTDLKSDVNSQLSHLKAKQDSDKTIQGSVDFCHYLLGKLNDIDFIYQKNINKEVQRNDICYQHLKESLDKLGFITKTTIEHCDICKFGFFYKDCGATVNSAIIKKLKELELADCDGTEYNHKGVVGGLAEFKMDNMKAYYAQIFADAVRVGSLLTHDALVRGIIVDKLVVFGLLTNYASKTSIVTKYYVDFVKDESIIYIGEEINTVKAFVGVVEAMSNL